MEGGPGGPRHGGHIGGPVTRSSIGGPGTVCRHGDSPDQSEESMNSVEQSEAAYLKCCEARLAGGRGGEGVLCLLML